MAEGAEGRQEVDGERRVGGAQAAGLLPFPTCRGFGQEQPRLPQRGEGSQEQEGPSQQEALLQPAQPTIKVGTFFFYFIISLS
jgi:hypothetical protein